uniref:NIF system FeS cluster assembly NifU N-terminal domain-containing protein n=1 Tax=Gouania willdenowi TaxID=441366 RepID=A0A8C5GRW7_GOUWI
MEQCAYLIRVGAQCQIIFPFVMQILVVALTHEINMVFSKKDSLIARNIIMDYFENPILKIDSEILDNSYFSFQNNSESCVDNIKVFLKIENNKIIDAKYWGLGCAISIASTEILLQNILDKSILEAQKIIKNYNDLLEGIENLNSEEIIGDLIVFHNVYQQPNRIRCAKISSDSVTEIFKNKKIKK